MKFKILLLLIISSILTFIIYNCTYKQSIYITSINTLSSNYNYNKKLSEKLLNKNSNINFNVDYSDETMEIENLIAEIQNNKNKIQFVIHKTKILIISIGNNDVNNESSKTILNEYKLLFELLRKYNNKQIIFISPYNYKYQTEIKNISSNFSIDFINYSSYTVENNITEPNLNKLVNNIVNKIYYLK